MPPSPSQTTAFNHHVWFLVTWFKGRAATEISYKLLIGHGSRASSVESRFLAMVKPMHGCLFNLFSDKHLLGGGGLIALQKHHGFRVCVPIPQHGLLPVPCESQRPCLIYCWLFQGCSHLGRLWKLLWWPSWQKWGFPDGP